MPATETAMTMANPTLASRNMPKGSSTMDSSCQHAWVRSLQRSQIRSALNPASSADGWQGANSLLCSDTDFCEVRPYALLQNAITVRVRSDKQQDEDACLHGSTVYSMVDVIRHHQLRSSPVVVLCGGTGEAPVAPLFRELTAPLPCRPLPVSMEGRRVN